MDKSEDNPKTLSKENLTLKITHNGQTKVIKSKVILLNTLLDIITSKDYN